MKINPDSVFGVEMSFDVDDNACIRVAGKSMFIVTRGDVATHVTRDGVRDVHVHGSTESEPGFVCLTTESGVKVFLSHEQVEAISSAMFEAGISAMAS